MTAILTHLERQLASARRLLSIVLAQGESIRMQDVEGLLARLADVQAELATRTQLEQERDAILRQAAGPLGLAPEQLDLEGVLTGTPPAEAAQARALSAELRGVLAEVGRVHDTNRILIRQELSFLSHLMRALSGAPQAGYSPEGWAQAPQPANAVDARA